jgi:hypothetical protein
MRVEGAEVDVVRYTPHDWEERHPYVNRDTGLGDRRPPVIRSQQFVEEKRRVGVESRVVPPVRPFRVTGYRSIIRQGKSCRLLVQSRRIGDAMAVV